MNDFLKNLSFIFLEADGEEDTQADDYSMDPKVSELGDQIDNQEEDTAEGDTEQTEEEGTDESTEENPEESEEAEDYSMDGETGEEGTDESTEEGEEDMEEDSEESDESDNERYKKYRLLKVYRDLLSDTNRLINSVNVFQNNIDSDLRDHSVYIENKLKELKDKCTFVIQHEFLVKPYTELLTSFLYFKKELDEILTLIEKIIKYNKE